MDGKVAFVGRVADPQTGNLPIRVLVDNPQGRLTIGESVRVSIIVEERKEALQVPAVAVLDLGEGPVLNVVRDGKSVPLHPEVGTPHGGWVAGLGHRPEGGRAGDRRGRIQLARGDPGEAGRNRRPSPRRRANDEPGRGVRNRRAAAQSGGGINLVARRQAVFRADRPDYGPLDRLRHSLDAPHAQRHLPRGRLPSDRRHRPDARPGGQRRRGGRDPADRGGCRHRAGRRPGPLQVGPRGRRVVDRLRPRAPR